MPASEGASATEERARERALDSAFAFLALGPFEEGRIRTIVRSAVGEFEDDTLFASGLGLSVLGPVHDGRLDRFRASSCRRLVAEREPGGLWRFWPAKHSRHAGIPPDLDDTACAAVGLRACGVDPGTDLRLLMRQRDPRGRLYTWLIPRQRRDRSFGPLRAHRAFVDAAHPFWTASEAAPEDADAGANANALLLLADSGEAGAVLATPIAEWLGELVANGAEGAADKWYLSAGTVRYLIARAFARGVRGLEPVGALLARRVSESARETLERREPLELALVASTARRSGAPVELQSRLLAQLVAQQESDGGFASAPFWFGGPRRTVSWSSRELTTLFAVEALLLAR